MIVLEFDATFFFTAIILSVVSGAFHHLGTWLHLYRLPMSLYSWISLGLAPVNLVFSVVLPFAVLYVLSMKATAKCKKPIMVSTFLGCWIGGLIVFSVHTYILYSSGGSFSSDSTFQLILWIIWEIFSTTLSAVFFVSLAAILFVHYQKTVNQ